METFDILLANFTILGALVILLLIVARFLKFNWVKKFNNLISENKLLLIFILSLGQMIGSLIYSELIGYAPCVFCWYQRVLLYPIVIIAGIAWWRKDVTARFYVIPLAIGAFLIGVYQYLLQITDWGFVSSVCSAESAVACSSIYVLEYGFITIPFMSIIISALILLIAITSASKD